MQSWTLKEIWDTTRKIAKNLKIKLGDIKYVSSENSKSTVKRISVCPYNDCSRSKVLGFNTKVNLEEIIIEYCKNYLKRDNK